MEGVKVGGEGGREHEDVEGRAKSGAAEACNAISGVSFLFSRV